MGGNCADIQIRPALNTAQYKEKEVYGHGKRRSDSQQSPADTGT